MGGAGTRKAGEIVIAGAARRRTIAGRLPASSLATHRVGANADGSRIALATAAAPELVFLKRGTVHRCDHPPAGRPP